MKKVVKGYCIAAIIGGVRKWNLGDVYGKWVDPFEQAALYKNKKDAESVIACRKKRDYEPLNYELHTVEMKLLD